MKRKDSEPAAEQGTTPITRRALIASAATAAGGALLASVPASGGGGHSAAAEQAPTSVEQAPASPALTVIPEDATKVPGTPTTAVSARSTFVSPARTPVGVNSGASFTPLQDLSGTITPSDLHFERHHNGVAHIDPAKYRLLVHGLVDRALVFTLADLRSLPSVTRIYFLECSGNGRGAYRAPKPDLTPQMIDGLTSNAEWTGVPAATLLREVGMRRGASWVLAEGGDAAVLSRSIPLAKMMDDALLVYAQNGEPLRPAAGYPVRLLLPGWEGNTCIKWLRRLEFVNQPNMSRDETSKYTDPLPNGSARQFSFEMDAKSIITHPAYPARLARSSWVHISGLAWSGRGKIARVEVTTDGGRSWYGAELQEPVLSKAHTRFQHIWRWDGSDAVLMSRAVDETGYAQPSLAEYRATRGRGTDYHFNHIRAWRVRPDGQVLYVTDA